MSSSARPQSPAAAAPEEETTPKTPLQVLLKKTREARGLSAQALSRIAGLNDRAYNLFEKGKAIPSETSWEKLCLLLAPVPPDVEKWWRSVQAQSGRTVTSFDIPENASVLQKWLIEVRKRTGLSKTAMSVACGFGTSTYTHYEDGSYLPPDIRLRKIAAFVGVVIPEEVVDYVAKRRDAKTASSVRQYEHSHATPITEWIHTQRVSAGITQQQLDAEFGWTLGYTKSIEYGGHLPSARCFRHLQYKFGRAPKKVRDWFKEAANKAKFKGFQNDREDISPFARIIREHRRAKGLSGTQLSQALGFGDNYIARLERGARTIPPKKVLHIAKFFGYETVPEDWLTALDVSGQVYHSRHEVKEADIPPLGLEIRRIRKRLLLSQHDVCRALGWGLQKMTTIELGVVAVNDETLAQIAKVLQLNEVPKEWYELRKQSRQVPQPHGVHGLTDHLSPFGRFIRSARMDLNLRQIDLSKMLGQGNTYMHEVEYGRATITTDDVHKILVKLGYPPTITKEIESMVDAAGQWRKFPGLSGDDLPPEGLEERIKRWHASRTIKAQADLENAKSWQVAERELGARLTWKERRHLANGVLRQVKPKTEKQTTPKAVNTAEPKTNEVSTLAEEVPTKAKKTTSKKVLSPKADKKSTPPKVTAPQTNPKESGDSLPPRGKLIQCLRNGLGISPTKLAEAANLKTDDITNLEDGKDASSFAVAGKVLFCLGFPLETVKQITMQVTPRGFFTNHFQGLKRNDFVTQWLQNNELPQLRTIRENPLNRSDKKDCRSQIFFRCKAAKAIPEFDKLPPFGSDIRQRRIAQGLSVEAFCQSTGLTDQKLTDIETGHTRVDAPLMAVLAKGLNLRQIPREWARLVSRSRQKTNYRSPFGRFLWEAVRSQRISQYAFLAKIDTSALLFNDLLCGAVPVTEDRLERILATLSLDAETVETIKKTVNQRGLFIDPKTGVEMSDARIVETLKVWHAAVVRAVKTDDVDALDLRARTQSEGHVIGNWLKQHRESEHLTVEQLARILNVAPSTYLEYETGQKVPNPGLRKVLKKLFGLLPKPAAES